MSIFSDLLTGGVGSIIETVGKVAGDLITTDKEREQLAIQAYEAETARMTAQTDINKVEAASSDPFTSRPRPFIMWVCGFAFAYATLIEPIMRFIATVMFNYNGAYPAIDTNLTLQVLLGLLGLGAMRSYDKKAGTSK